MFMDPNLKAVTAGGTLWAMDRSTFRRIVLKSAFQKRKMYEALLEKVPLLHSLSVSDSGMRFWQCLVMCPTDSFRCCTTFQNLLIPKSSEEIYSEI